MKSKGKSSRKITASRQSQKRQARKRRKAGDKTDLLNGPLVDLSKKTENELEYWKTFQGYLISEREVRRERLLEALRTSSVSGFETDSLVRIVDSRYQTRPLSPYGSVAVPPGGRFNFGEISAYHQKF